MRCSARPSPPLGGGARCRRAVPMASETTAAAAAAGLAGQRRRGAAAPCSVALVAVALLACAELALGDATQQIAGARKMSSTSSHETHLRGCRHRRRDDWMHAHAHAPAHVPCLAGAVATPAQQQARAVPAVTPTTAAGRLRWQCFLLVPQSAQCRQALAGPSKGSGRGSRRAAAWHACCTCICDVRLSGAAIPHAIAHIALCCAMPAVWASPPPPTQDYFVRRLQHGLRTRARVRRKERVW